MQITFEISIPLEQRFVRSEHYSLVQEAANVSFYRELTLYKTMKRHPIRDKGAIMRRGFVNECRFVMCVLYFENFHGSPGKIEDLF